MKYLITGSAGFIGFHLTSHLLNEGHEICGVDNLNDYYDISLKRARLIQLENHKHSCNFNFFEFDLKDKEQVKSLFSNNSFDYVIHLAAQAGVRYSIENPYAYLDANLEAFINILECCKSADLKKFIFASSSSVYGLNKKSILEVDDKTDHPISLYAATKKSNEVIAHTYSHLFDIPTIGLRFFTVYGPYGRPDMAYFKFTKSILSNEKIKLFNNGKMERDFTHIDDIVSGIMGAVRYEIPAQNNENTHSKALYSIFNLGNNSPTELHEFVRTIEYACKKDAKIEYHPLQPGDVVSTFADISESKQKLNFEPKVNLEDGILEFVEWYKKFYGKG